MYAWRGRVRGSGEDQHMWLHASLFAPHVWELLLVCFCVRYSRVDISFVLDSLCCYSVNPLEAWLLLQPRCLQTGSRKRRHRVEEGANLSGAEEQTGSHVQTHVSIQITEHVLNKNPLLCDKQAAHAFIQSHSPDVVVCPLWGWCVESVSVQHELIITSVWSCLERSRYTPCACVCVCLCQNVRHTAVSLLAVVFLYVSPEHQPVSLHFLSLSPSEPTETQM